MESNLDEEYTLVNKKHDSLEIQKTNLKGYFSSENSIQIKQYIGLNTDNPEGTQNFTLIKQSHLDRTRLKLYFMLYRIGNRHYININNTHVVEIKKFLMIKKMSIEMTECVAMVNSTLGEIIIDRCDMDMINKCIQITEKYLENNKTNTLVEYLEYMLS